MAGAGAIQFAAGRGGLPWLLALSACSPPVTRLAPPEGAKSAAIAVQTGAGTLLFATELDPSGALELPDGVPGGAPTHVLFYPWRLEELQLPEGFVPSPSDELPKRALPVPMATFEGRIDGLASEWTERPDDEARRSELRVPELDLIRCVSQGGCLARDEDRRVACTMPCPSPPEPRSPMLASVSLDPPEPPAPVHPVRLLPCPSGWTVVAETGDAPARCEPPSVPSFASCGPNEAQFYGASVCTPIGLACPSGEFAPTIGLPGGRPIFYVRANGTPGGSGTITAPFGSLSEALASAPSDAILLLSKGTFRERNVIETSVMIVGACVAETVLEPPANEGCCEPVLRLSPPTSVLIRNLSMRGDTNLLRAAGQVQLDVEDLSLDATADRSWGLVAHGGALVRGRGLVVRGSGEEAIHVFNGAQVALERVVLEGFRTPVRVDRLGSELRLRALVVREDQLVTSASRILAFDQGFVRVEDAWIERGRASALTVDSLGVAELVAVTIVSRSFADPNTHAVVSVAGGGRGRLERSLITGGDTMLMDVEGEGSSLSVTQSVIREGLRSVVTTSYGAAAVTDGELRLDRVLIERNAGGGIWLDGRGRLSGSDLIVSENDHRRSPGEEGGLGLLVEGEAQVDLDRVFMTNNGIGALYAHGRARVTLTDLVAYGHRLDSSSSSASGLGLLMVDQSQLVLERAVLGPNDGPALWLEGSVTATLTHVQLFPRGRVDNGTADLLVTGGARVSIFHLATESTRIGTHRGRLELSDSVLAARAEDEAPLYLDSGSEVVLDRVIIEHPGQTAYGLEILGSTAELRDVVHRGSTVRFSSSTVSVSRMQLEDGRLHVVERSVLSGADLTSLGSFENALNVDGHAWARLSRVYVEGALGNGVRLATRGRLEVEDLSAERCQTAIGSYEGGELHATRFRISGSADVGAVFEPSFPPLPGRELRLQDGVFSEQPVGVRAFSGYDLLDVVVRVQYRAVPVAIQD